MVFIYVLVLTIVMTAYVGSLQILNQKTQISQIARKYILRMETVGYLMDNDRMNMEEELHAAGAENIDFSGTTFHEVEFGSPIYLTIKGQLTGRVYRGRGNVLQAFFEEGLYGFEERKMSTAKN